MELLNDKQCVMLEIIKKNNRDDVQGCCTQMFIYWLKVDIEASWNKLIEALKEIRQNSLAMEIITDILKKGFSIWPCIMIYVRIYVCKFILPHHTLSI